MMKLLLCAVSACTPLIAENIKDKSVVDSTNQLALKLMNHIGKEGENLCISPYSIQSALSMTSLGAVGQTQTEMARVLSHPVDKEASIHQSVGEYEKDLAKRFAKESSEKAKLEIANRIFVDKEVGLKEDFINQTKKYYHSTAEKVDFKGDKEGARLKINQWVSDKTENKIKNLLSRGTVDSETSLVLVNAIYFKAKWESTFKKSSTHKATFSNTDGSNSKVDFMHKNEHFGYSENEDYQVVTIPYKKEQETQLTVVLPREGKKLKDVTSVLTFKQLTDFKTLAKKDLILSLPKFEQQGGSIDLAPTLKDLGMKVAFSRTADFSKISSTQNRLSSVVHKTFIKIDEEGGEAAAATAAILDRKSEALSKADQPLIVKVNRPFFYAIQDSKTGLCLFVGTVNKLN